MLYEPVRIDGREFIDGGIRSTTNIDVAVEHGAKFIVVINPVVPYVNDFRKRIPTIMGTRARRVSDMGFTAIGNQAFRLLSHERLHIAVQHWEERYPGVDIILIEPEFDDELMFGTSIMDYSARLEIAKHGFESVTLQAGPRLRALQGDRRAPRDRDLRPPGSPRPRPGRARARARVRLAPGLGADDRGAAPQRPPARGGRGRGWVERPGRLLGRWATQLP